MNIDELGKQYQSIEEWRAFSEAQHKQVASLMRKIKELEANNKDLKKQLVSMPIPKDVTLSGGQSNLLLKSDVETIADVQLKVLKDISFERELTLEEAKKCEIFNKIVLSHKNQKEDVPTESKSLTEAELISIANG